MASIIKADTLQSTTSNVFVLNSAGTEYARFDSSGVFQLANPTTFPAGTAALPSITATGDTNTGLYFPAADTIAFAEGGVEAMRINSSGDVGIGTSSPSGKLHVESAGTNYIYTRNGSASGIAGVVFQNTTDTRAWRIDGTNLDAYDMSAGVTRMRIDSSGNMFVGGTAQNTATKPVYSSTTAKAWVSCSIASSTVTIGASFNVSSVTRNGGGDYTINFSSALADTSYAIAGIASGPGGANAQPHGYNGGGVAVGSYRFYVLNMTNITPTEPNNFYLIFFR